MKKLITILLVGVITICSSTVSTYAADIGSSTEETTGYEINNPERIIFSYEKTITIFYSSFSSITTTYYYEEYRSDYMSWFRGTLNLAKVEPYLNGYQVTYKGTLVGTL